MLQKEAASTRDGQGLTEMRPSWLKAETAKSYPQLLFRAGHFANPRAPGIPPTLLATYTVDFDTVDDARKAAIADADNPKIGAVASISIEPIGERWVKGESLVRTGSGWERLSDPE